MSEMIVMMVVVLVLSYFGIGDPIKMDAIKKAQEVCEKSNSHLEQITAGRHISFKCENGLSSGFDREAQSEGK